MHPSIAGAWQARGREPSRRRDQPVPPPARGQPGRLVSVGRRGARRRAREEDKPILLSIGYAACHWCHVMEHESFEDPATAAVMNEHFVSIKVDREERPDLDAVYMEAVVAMSGHGGWPMTVFLTPAGEPFYGGTYYPPEPRHGLPSFRQVLEAIAEAWRERRDDVARSAEQLVEAVRQSASLRPSLEPLTDELLADACARRRRGVRAGVRRLGPRAEVPERARCSSSCSAAATTRACAMVVKTLDEMAAGGMYDLLGGGFHRYSVDDRWLVPHFEKMLYDNALLAPAYLHGWLVTGDDRYRAIAEATSRVHAPRAAAARGRLRLGAGCGHGRRRRAHVHLDRGRGRSGRACSSRSSTGARSSAATLDEDCAPGSSSCGSSARSRFATTRRSRPGTGLRSRRSRKPAGGSSGRTGSTRRTNAGGVPARSALRRRRPAAAQLSRRPHERRRLSRRLRERGARAPRAPRRDRRGSLAPGGEPARATRDRALRRRRARRLLPLARPTASASSRGRRSSTTTRSPPATRCSRTC